MIVRIAYRRRHWLTGMWCLPEMIELSPEQADRWLRMAVDDGRYRVLRVRRISGEGMQ